MPITSRTHVAPLHPAGITTVLIHALTLEDAVSVVATDGPITPATRLVRDLDFDLVRLAGLAGRLDALLRRPVGQVIAEVCTARGRVVDVEVAVLAEALAALTQRPLDGAAGPAAVGQPAASRRTPGLASSPAQPPRQPSIS